VSTEAQTGLRFTLRWPDGRTEILVVDAERALIGSAAHCEVRLPAGAVQPEHLDVVLSGGSIHVAARAIAAPGVQLPLGGVWHPGQAIELAGVCLTVDPVNLLPDAKRRSPFWLFAIVPLAALAAALVYVRASSPAEAAIPEAPPLFDRPVDGCAGKPAEQVGAFAAEKMRVALAKRERSPFSPRDGVDAVPLFELAGACFRAARFKEEEAEASGAAQTLRKRLEDEYRARRVRMEHAVRVGDPFGAKRELGVLIPMTAHRRGAYLDWMVAVDRYASLEVEQRKNPGLSGR